MCLNEFHNGQYFQLNTFRQTMHWDRCQAFQLICTLTVPNRNHTNLMKEIREAFETEDHTCSSCYHSEPFIFRKTIYLGMF